MSLIEELRSLAGNHYGTGDVAVYRFLNSHKPVEKYIDREEHRWWDSYFTAIQLNDGRYIMYDDASANRDESIWDLGWEFDISLCVEVEPYEESIVVTKWRNK